VLGLSFGWRAENRLLGWLKLAPVSAPQSVSLQLLAGRRVRMPYDPAWTKDGWYTPLTCDSCPTWGFSETEVPGWKHYKAADHVALTDERQALVILNLARTDGPARTSATLGWAHATSVRSPSGLRGDATILEQDLPVFGDPRVGDTDPFHVYWGDDPLHRESGSDALTLRADHARPWRGTSVKTGAGLTYEDVRLHELDGASFGRELDSLRAWRAFAPGAFAYGQLRWQYQGMVINAGARAQFFSPGRTATPQTLGDGARGRWSLSPRLGIAYPISVRDVFSLAYARLEQDPARDFLYDNRRRVGNRQPIGDASLVPASVVSYQGAVKHLFGPDWAAQASLFYRDVFGQVGARNDAPLPGGYELRYTNDDEAHAIGVEVGVAHEAGEERRVALQVTWMQSYGNESRPEGDPFGPVRGPEAVPLGDRPLSWDRRYALSFSGAWPLRDRWTLAWATVGGSGLPWTPKVRREPFTDLSQVNSRRFGWSENTDASLRWRPRFGSGLVFGFEARNLFDEHTEQAVTVDGYPHDLINTVFDDYGAYRTETGQPGGAWWDERGGGRWVVVNDPRLFSAPRRLRASVSASW
jgi:hypothetical protein